MTDEIEEKRFENTDVLGAEAFMQIVESGAVLDEGLLKRERELTAKEILAEAAAMTAMFVPVKITQKMRDLGLEDEIRRMTAEAELRLKQTMLAQAGDFHEGATLQERTAAARSKLLKERLEKSPNEELFFG